MEVALDDKLMTPVPGKDTYISQEHHKVGFTVSKRSKTGADMLHVSAGGLAMSVFISKLPRFDETACHPLLVFVGFHVSIKDIKKAKQPIRHAAQ